MKIEAYPLYWPQGYGRTTHSQRARFVTTLGKARDYVKDEIRRLGGKHPIISTNIPLKNDGDLRADWTKYKTDDKGVAVYFEHKGNQVCLCCDKYNTVWDNLYAIGRTIAALRQIDRDGVSDFLNRAFTGFKALPDNSTINMFKEWHNVFGLPETATVDMIKSRYKELSKFYHPDMPNGDKDKFQEINNAYEQAKKIKNFN